MPYDTGDTPHMALAVLNSKFAREYVEMLQSFLHHLETEGGVKPGSDVWKLAADAFTNGFAGGLAFGTGLTLEEVESDEP